MTPDSPIEDVKYCFGTFHDRPLATFKDDGSYTWNRALVHECRTCEHINACFFISTQVKMSKDESLGRGKGQRDHRDREPCQGPSSSGHDHCHPHRSHHHHGHHGHQHFPREDRRPNQAPPRKDVLDILGDFVQVLKDHRG